MTIAVTGATGHLGRLVVSKLKEKGESPIALARSPEKAADLGVEARAADYAKAETLQPALEGVDTLLLISSSEVGQRADQHRNVIAAAKAAGVKRIVYTSLLRTDTTPLALGDEHRQTEAELKASGIAYTILRNGWYTENYAAAIPGAVQGGVLIGSAGEGRISSATREDYAEAAIEALTGEGHEGKVYELAGDEAYTLSQFANEISRHAGREIAYKDLPEAEYAQALASHGLPEVFAGIIADSDAGAAKGALFDDSRTLSRLIGRPTTPFTETVKASLI